MDTGRPTFFVTAVCHQRAAVFRNERLALLMVEVLYSYREQRKYLLHEFVLMHDHVHLLLTPPETISLEKTMQFIKGGYSFQVKKRFGSNKEIWQKSFTHESVKGAAAYEGFREYIQQNPVKARLCVKPDEFPYSSSNPRFVMDPPPEYLRG